MILADAGFLYALLDRDDAWHARALAAADALDEAWITTWPVLTEAVHLATRWLGAEAAIALMQEVARGDLAIWDISTDARRRLPTLMRRYADLPMDLADASLVLLAEAQGHGRILTTDTRDFRAYRWKSRAPFENLLEQC
ncbi:VapC toxin family PIN domain ribonuclease [Fontimonas sp. SYSU GA230001]|uniref:type II toxin-antitoxin system VapC family toxin n=1 Tax=Fontimonas sp. SYSU GA230001 TaxID=3142450 RepID=UPI0032B44130